MGLRRALYMGEGSSPVRPPLPETFLHEVWIIEGREHAEQEAQA